MRKNRIRQIAVLSILLAMEIVLSRFLSFSVWNMKIGLSFVPLMLAAYLYGPIGGILVGGLGDLIGALAFPIGPYFPGFTATAAFSGFVFGLALNKKCSFMRILISVLFTQLINGLLLNTYWISVLYGSPFDKLFITRLPEAAIMIVLEIVFAELIFVKFDLLKKLKLDSKQGA
ncbi:MAG: folate family ECF transporter S component [Clostridia bacterium]|nr:folate family ECF transporter S component [Clostridia bacterium]